MALSSVGHALLPVPTGARSGAHLGFQQGSPLPLACARRKATPGPLAQSLGRALPLARCAAEQGDGGGGAREWPRQYPVREYTGVGSFAGRRGTGGGRGSGGRGALEGRVARGGRGRGDWNRGGAGENSLERDEFRREADPEGSGEDSDGSTGGSYRSFRGRGGGPSGGRAGGRGAAGREGRWGGRGSGGEGRGPAFRDGPVQRGRPSGQFEEHVQARVGRSPPGFSEGRVGPGAEREGSAPRFQLDAEGNLKLSGAATAPGTEPRASSSGTRPRQQRSPPYSAEAVPGTRGSSYPAQRAAPVDAAGAVLGGGETVQGAGSAGVGRGGVQEVDPDAPVRVSKLLSERGLCSRREADGFISRGLVLLDGQPVTELGARALRSQSLALAPEAQRQQAQRLTVLLHKPVGYVSHADDEGAYPPASNLITPDRRWQGPAQGAAEEGGGRGAEKFGAPSEPPPRGLAPAGRLDIDSTGLLVLTQDGRVARALVGEEGAVEKEYLVRVEGRISSRNLALLNEGLHLDGRPLRPALVEWQNAEQLRFVLREGRKRQIRRMCELVGLRVLALKRVRIGRVPLGNLPLGQWRVLGPHESF